MWEITIPFTGKTRKYHIYSYVRNGYIYNDPSILNMKYCVDSAGTYHNRLYELKCATSDAWCFCKNNSLYIVCPNRTIVIHQILKTALWNWLSEQPTDIYRGYSLTQLFQEMMFSNSDRLKSYDVISSLLEEPNRKIKFVFKDGTKTIRLHNFESWASEYLNTLLLGDAPEEIFSDLTLDEFDLLHARVWRANDLKLYNKVALFGGSYFFLRAKSLYQSIASYPYATTIPIVLRELL